METRAKAKDFLKNRIQELLHESSEYLPNSRNSQWARSFFNGKKWGKSDPTITQERPISNKTVQFLRILLEVGREVDIATGDLDLPLPIFVSILLHGNGVFARAQLE